MVKQAFALLLALAFILCLAACGDSEQSAQETTATEETKTEAVEPEEVEEPTPEEDAAEEEPVEEEPALEEAVEEEPSAEEQSEAAEEEDPAYALYNKFIEDLKNGGVIDDVDDSGGPVDGMWIFYANDNWNALSTAQKQTLADSILGEIAPWADGMFGIAAPLVVIEDWDGSILAQSNFSASAMNVK